MDGPRVDWGTAEVRDGTLIVAIAGERPRGWTQTFTRTTKLLSDGPWHDVKLRSGRVTVRGVPADSEEKLRVLLEGAVQESNATHPPADGGAADEESTEGPDGDDDSDARMTERFRSFADERA